MTPNRSGSTSWPDEPRIVHGLLAGTDRELGEAIESLDVLGRDKLAGVPIVDVTTELDLEFGGVEQADSVDSALALQDSLPEIGNSTCHRSDDSQPCDDDASLHTCARYRARLDPARQVL